MTRNKIDILEIQITFVPTVPVLLPLGSACGSFFQDSSFTTDNTPPMPLIEAHLGGFFFLAKRGKLELNEIVQFRNMFV